MQTGRNCFQDTIAQREMAVLVLPMTYAFTLFIIFKYLSYYVLWLWGEALFQYIPKIKDTADDRIIIIKNI